MAETSPLHLRHSHFTNLSVKAISGFSRKDCPKDGPYPSCEGLDLNIEVALAKLNRQKDDPAAPQFVIRVSITGEPAEGRTFPYEISATIEGIFHVSGDFPKDVDRLVTINGASMLYGAMREQLLTLTGRHTYGAIILPTVSFINFAPNDSNTEKAQKSIKPSGQKPPTK